MKVDGDCIGALRIHVVALNPMQKVLRQPCLAAWAFASQSLAGVLNVAVSLLRRLICSVVGEPMYSEVDVADSRRDNGGFGVYPKQDDSFPTISVTS